MDPLELKMRRPLKPTMLTFLFFIVAFLLVFGRSMMAGLEVDEHSFVTTGALLARRSLLPYRDYHYNHMPTLILVYAGLFRMTDHLLLAARAFSALCAALASVVIFSGAYCAVAQCA